MAIIYSKAGIEAALAEALAAGDFVTAGELSSLLGGKVNTGTFSSQMALKANLADLASVAQTGSYTDLANKPTIPNSPASIGAQPAGNYVTTTALADALDGFEGGSGGTVVIGAARSQLAAPAYGSSVTNRGANRSVSTSFGTTNLIETTRIRHVLTEDTSSIHLVFMGWYGGETDQVDATIKATIETATGSLHKLTFRGSRTHLLTTGSSVTTDPLGLVLKKGDVIWVRTTRTIASGTYYANAVLRGTIGEGKTLTDVADSGTITAATDDTTTGGFTATAVVSGSPTTGNSVILIGDSVSNGKGETVEETGGYMARALPDSAGVLRLNAGGGTAGTFVGNTVNAGAGRRRLPFASSGRYAWVEYGINDISGAADAQTVKDTLLRLWTSLSEMGLQVYQSTLTLWSGGSTDGYTTLENQTLWAKHSIRVEINDWIRTKPAPLTGYFEMADAIESSRNSGKWRVDLGALTTDGIHPNTLGHQTVATAISAAVTTAFTYVPATLPTGGPTSPTITFKDTAGNLLTGRSLVVVVDTTSGEVDILVSSGPDTVAPSTPGTPTVTAGVGQIVVGWAASTDNTAVASYRVYRSDNTGTPLATVTGLSYTDTSAVAGTAYTYRTEAVDTSGNVSTKSNPSASATATAPGIVNNTLPAISGTATEGQVLTTTNGAWTPTPDSYGYQWKRAGTAISGATASTYTLVTADVGNAITVTVTANKSGASPASATSSATNTVTPVGGTALNNTVAPNVTGSPSTGATLSTTNGTWSATPDSFTYQWKRAGSNISGATSSTYTLVTADEGQAISCAVTAVKTGYTSGTASSNTVTPSGTPSGTAFVEDTFTEASGGGLAGHTGENGATWTLNTGTSTGSALVTNNRVRHGNTSTTIYTASGTPTDADYTVSADFVFVSIPTGHSAGIIGRASATAVQYFGLRYSQSAGNWALIRQSGATTLQSFTHTPTVGQTYRGSLTFVTTTPGGIPTTTVTGTISGGDLSTPIVLTATDTVLMSTGLAGLNFSSASGSASSAAAGIHIDNFLATN